MSCETNIAYNGIPLQNVLTEHIECTVERDSTGVDPIGIRVNISVIAMVHTSTTVAHGFSVGTWGAAASISPGIRTVIEKLSLPRKRFIMTIGDQTLYDILPSGKEPGWCNTTPTIANYYRGDIDNGPWPDVKVLAIHGQSTAKCRFNFRFMIPICENPYNLSDILNLRYWIADNIDCSTWLTTRRYQGVFRVRCRDAAGSINPHMLARQLTLPPLQSGFRRAAIEWSEDPNPLLFHFAVTDVEQWAQAPSPATDWDGSYSISIPQGEVCADAELNFRLKADKGVNKRHLLQLAQRIIDAKLHYQELLTDTSCLLMSEIWHESLKDNEIGANLRVRYVGPEWVHTNLPERSTIVGPSFDLGLPLTPVVSDFDDNPRKRKYDKEIATTPGLPTATTAGLFLCALQTPCCPASLTAPPVEYDAPVYKVETKVETSEGSFPDKPLLPKSNSRYSSSHKLNPYMWYKITNHYVEDTGWRAFPLGKQCSTAVSSSSSQDTVAFSHLHCPVITREVHLSACRVDAWPQLPKKKHWKDDKADVKYVLKWAKLNPSVAQLTADGKHEIREISAAYFYYMSRPPDSDKDILVGKPATIDDYGTGSAIAMIQSLGGLGSSSSEETFVDPVIILGGGS